MDAVFQGWLESELVWIPGRGMGRYPVSESPYDLAYFQKYAEYAETDLGRQLTETRLSLVERYLPADALVLDVGIGSGQFVEARGGATYGYDVNLAGIAWLKARGLFLDPLAEDPYAICAMTFWDALEHIHDPGPLLARCRSLAFMSLPIVPGSGPPPRDWRHTRTDEHVHYWTRDGLIGWMAEHGFRCLEHGTTESLLGRLDAHTFAFQRTA